MRERQRLACMPPCMPHDALVASSRRACRGAGGGTGCSVRKEARDRRERDSRGCSVGGCGADYDTPHPLGVH